MEENSFPLIAWSWSQKIHWITEKQNTGYKHRARQSQMDLWGVLSKTYRTSSFSRFIKSYFMLFLVWLFCHFCMPFLTSFLLTLWTWIIKGEIIVTQKEDLYSIPAFFLAFPGKAKFMMSEIRSLMRHRLRGHPFHSLLLKHRNKWGCSINRLFTLSYWTC